MAFLPVQVLQLRTVAFKVFGDDTVNIAGYGRSVFSRHAHYAPDRLVVLPADIYRLMCGSFRLASVKVLVLVGFLSLLSSENVDVQ